MSGLFSESERTEEARIRAVYAKRQGDDARYSWFSPGQLFIVQERERRVLALLRRHDFASLSSKKILEIGCGTGYWLREFVKWGAKPENITGIDLLPDRIAEAKSLCPSGIKFHCGNAANLDFQNSTFDLVVQSTAFTSILDPALKKQVAREMIRVLKEKGIILWYDYHVNNPWNPDVQGIKKREISILFQGCHIDLQRITLAPPLARWIASRSWLLAYLLERIPLLRTHYIGVVQKL
jgi:ubiquinone/menaquinone biosynthesis C-methylase UbiE